MENIDYKHLYLKYKKKYLNLKNQIGGSAPKRTLQELAANVPDTPHTPKKRRIKIRRIPQTAQTQREYYNFFYDVLRVLYCINLKLQKKGLNISVNFNSLELVRISL